MKYAVSIFLILFTSVTFMYYLLNNPNFLPVNNLGEYNWINIFTLIFLIFLTLFSLFNVLIYSIHSFFKKRLGKEELDQAKLNKENRVEEGIDIKELDKKELNRKETIIISVKFSLILTIGILTVFILNFFHILNWIWGASILVVVLIFVFII